MATYKVGSDGKAQSGLKAGDKVVTAGGTYTISSVNSDGSYKSSLTDKSTTTKNYSGAYANSGSSSSGKSSGSSSSNKSSGSSSTTTKTTGQSSGNSEWDSKYGTYGTVDGGWQALINKAAAAGDNTAAAYYERMRNEKINSADYTGNETVTYNYNEDPNATKSLYEQMLEDWKTNYETQYSEGLAAAQEANQAGVDASVAEIEATLENGVTQYSQDAAEAYLQSLKEQKNARQSAAYNGDLGGIGQKQYSNAEATYDAAMLSIELEREAFINSCNQQIDQLKAAGRQQDAELLAEWAQTKLQDYSSMIQNAYSMALSEKQLAQSQANTDREYALQRAQSNLSLGFVTADDIEALGISADEAQKYADLINEEAQVNLAYAKKQLELLGTSASTSTSTATDTDTESDTADETVTGAQEGDTLTVTTASGKTVRVRYSGGNYYDIATGQEYDFQTGDSFDTEDGSKVYVGPDGSVLTADEYKYVQNAQSRSNWYTKYNGTGALGGGGMTYSASTPEGLYSKLKSSANTLATTISNTQSELRRLNMDSRYGGADNSAEQADLQAKLATYQQNYQKLVQAMEEYDSYQ